ncbi:MAG: ATP-dependent DNA helicase RecG [Planctomycetes bacterium]|nr:ATP-dependent DNA helicase RecG [Planctomycetota bacterium]
MELSTEAQFLKGVGPARARALATLGIRTVEDLLHHYPRRHEDRSRLRPIDSVREGETVTVGGEVVDVRLTRLRGRLSLVSVTVRDGSGSLDLQFWNQPFRERQFPVGRQVVATGRAGYRRVLHLVAPEVEIIPDEGEEALIHTGRITPIYPLTRGISGGAMRRMLWNAVHEAAGLLGEFLPDAQREGRDLPPLSAAIRGIHFPADQEELGTALRRLKHDELFLFELAMALRRRVAKSMPRANPFRFDGTIDHRIRARIPFALTAAQERAIAEIVGDMTSPEPMTRLLQGDVGSGKTIVALYAVLVAVANRRQVALMAPTEILAEQHYRTFRRLLEGSRVRIGLLIGSLPAKERRATLAGIASGEVAVTVGTHALIQQGVEFRDLALAVVDEQHRFGVRQRAGLLVKGTRPDSLFMTATPIPRTLTMTVFGDLDVSVLDEMPPGRRPVRTLCFPRTRYDDACRYIRSEIDRGRQAFFVFPLVEESEEMPLRSVIEEVERLRREVFPGVSVGLIHGRLSRADKEEAMRRFRDREDLVLAATTVVEVGIDVPNATVMVVENAERYGLSQLHQLRGRVGRGAEGGTFVLLGDPATEEGRRRLRILTETTDGFRIAEEDLRLRGPGEFLGTRQHGVPELRLADLFLDFALLTRVREDAFRLIAADPGLAAPQHAPLRCELMRRLGDRLALGGA